MQNTHETCVNLKINKLITDKSICEEIRQSLKTPLLNALEDIENIHMRIRRSIFIGIYSFWEVSLHAMLHSKSSFYINKSKVPSQIIRKDKTSKVRLYLQYIYGNNIPKQCLLLDKAIRIFRNCIVHGSLSPNQKKTIEELKNTNPEMCLSIINNECVITNYSGLYQLLNIIKHELNKAELKLIDK